MRSTSLVLVAAAGIAAVTFAAPAGAFTPTSSAGLGTAAQAIDPVASVHCRPFKHRSFNHPWGFGCRGGRVSIHEREGVSGRVSIHEREGRDRVSVREREGRSRVSVREREGSRARVGVHERSTTRSQTNTRSRERSDVRGEVKSGNTRSSTTGKSGTTGKSSTTTGGGGTSGQSSGGQK